MVAVLLAATGAALVLAALVKGPCLGHVWDGYENERLCYNDLQALYYTRGFDEKRLPYVELRLEYPVFTGLLIYLASLPSDNAGEFWTWNAILLTPFALGSTLLLYRLAPDPRRVAFWAAGPSLVLYAFHNWDLPAVFFTLLAFHAHQRDRPGLAGAALALGASAKFYPGLFAPFFFLAYFRNARRMAGPPARFGAGFLGAAALLNLPFLLANPDGFLYTYRFHLERSATYESFWFLFVYVARRTGWSEAAWEDFQVPFMSATAAVFLAAFAAIAWAQWRRKLGLVHASLAALLAFLLLSKVFSVQYALWILPFFALLPLGIRRFAPFAAADAAVYVAVFTFFVHLADGTGDAFYPWLAAAVVARTAVLAWLGVGAVARRRPASEMSEPPPSLDPTPRRN